MTTRLEYFRSIPWCSSLLKHPQLTLLHDVESIDDEETNFFFNKLLRARGGIHELLMFYYAPTEEEKLDNLVPVPELFLLVDAGENLSGWPGVGHGGFVSTIFDVLGGWHSQRNIHLSTERGHLPEGSRMMTVQLQVKYLKPVLVNQVILLKSRVDRVEGKKMYVQMILEDKSGTILSQGELIAFIATPRAKI